MVKLLKTIVAIPLVLAAAYAAADNHSNAPLGYGISYILKVSDPGAIAGAMTEVRTTDLGKNSPSGVVLNQLVAGGEKGATHTIGVFYQSAENIDKAQAMNEAMRVGEKIGSIFQSASERIHAVLWTLSRSSANEGRVTSDNPVSMGYLLAVSDQSAFIAAFDPLWNSVTESFPGNVSFGTVLANGASPATHWVNFSANNMETLLTGVQAMQTSPEMAAYTAKAPSFRSVVGESINRRLLSFPESSQ
jgi:hypothetical protein